MKVIIKAVAASGRGKALNAKQFAELSRTDQKKYLAKFPEYPRKELERKTEDDSLGP